MPKEVHTFRLRTLSRSATGEADGVQRCVGCADYLPRTQALGAKISAISCEVKIRAPSSPLGNYLLDIPAMVAAEIKKSATNAQQLLAAFQDAAEKRGVFQERISEHC